VTQTPLRSRSPGRFAHRRVGASGGCSGGRGKLLLHCRFGTHEGVEGRGHIAAVAHLQLLMYKKEKEEKS